MNTCKDCKWWFQKSSVLGKCLHPYLLPEYSITKYIKVEKDKVETGPDFGCIHWEKKE